MPLQDTLNQIVQSTQARYDSPNIDASHLDYVPSMRDRITDNLPLVPEGIERMMMSDQYKMNKAKKVDFVTALLKRETGAVIDDSEMDWADQTFFPQMGDNRETLENKRQARIQAIQELEQSGNPRDAGFAGRMRWATGAAMSPEERAVLTKEGLIGSIGGPVLTKEGLIGAAGLPALGKGVGKVIKREYANGGDVSMAESDLMWRNKFDPVTGEMVIPNFQMDKRPAVTGEPWGEDATLATGWSCFTN